LPFARNTASRFLLPRRVAAVNGENR
jgi:hypothetical protein